MKQIDKPLALAELVFVLGAPVADKVERPTVWEPESSECRGEK